MKKEHYFEEVKGIEKRVEELKSRREWKHDFHCGYYVGMLTGITYMFIKEFCNDNEAWNEFEILQKEVEDKIYEIKSI